MTKEEVQLKHLLHRIYVIASRHEQAADDVAALRKSRSEINDLIEAQKCFCGGFARGGNRRGGALCERCYEGE